MKAKFFFITVFAAVDAYFAGFALGFNSRHALIGDPKIPAPIVEVKKADTASVPGDSKDVKPGGAVTGLTGSGKNGKEHPSELGAAKAGAAKTAAGKKGAAKPGASKRSTADKSTSAKSDGKSAAAKGKQAPKPSGKTSSAKKQ